MSQYAKRDTEDLMEFYLRHVDAMTTEELHEKSDIAAELAWRDMQIERQNQLLLKAYHSGHRMGWEDESPSVSEVMEELHDHLCNVGLMK